MNSENTPAVANAYSDSSESDDGLRINVSSQRSNPLSAPDLQLDCFTDSSSEYENSPTHFVSDLMNYL